MTEAINNATNMSVSLHFAPTAYILVRRRVKISNDRCVVIYDEM